MIRKIFSLKSMLVILIIAGIIFIIAGIGSNEDDHYSRDDYSNEIEGVIYIITGITFIISGLYLIVRLNEKH